VTLQPHEVEVLLATYRAHPKPLGEECGCGQPGCNQRAEVRRQLWQAGINPEYPNVTLGGQR
jgi:hypothetical protein